MLVGIIAGLGTCALWGLTFVAPRAVAPFNAWDLTIARYCIFGLFCALLMFDRRFRPTGSSFGRMAIGLLLGGAGYVGYFVSAAFAVRFSGAAIPPVIIGTMPVFLSIIANARDRSAPWRMLVMPLGLIAVGVAIVNVATIVQARPLDRENIQLGIFASVIALGIWIIYGLVNARVMRAADAPDGLKWTGLQGIGAAIGSFFLLPFTTFGSIGSYATSDLDRFFVWALMMGIAGSWLATWFWVIASRRLSLTLSAQLILAETMFGLVYGFIYEERWPSAAEAVGATLQISGVCLVIALFSRRAMPQRS